MADGPRLSRRGLLGLLALGAVICAAEAAEDRQQQLQQLHGRIGELQSDLDSAHGQSRALERELRGMETQVGESTRRLRELERELGELQHRLKGLEQDRARQQKALSGQREALAAQLRAAYAMGRQERLKIMLNQQDPAVASRVMVYYDYFHRARSEKLAQIAGLIEQIGETEAQARTGQARLQELQGREQEQKQQLEQASAGRQRVLRALRLEIRDKDQELAGLKKDEEQLQALMARLQREAEQREAERRAAEQREAERLAAERRAAERQAREEAGRRQAPPRKAPPRVMADHQKQAPFSQRKGSMAWPVDGRLAASFGQERGGGLRWDGVFIAAAEGSEVQAIHQGRVVFADWLRGFGLLLIIDHGGGYLSLYGHNRSLYKQVGETVAAGETVAQVGSSGGALSSGVYFGIRQQGKPVNPMTWCQAAAGNKVGMAQPAGPVSEVGSEAAQGAAESKA